jgi:hypothetical protein
VNSIDVALLDEACFAIAEAFAWSSKVPQRDGLVASYRTSRGASACIKTGLGLTSAESSFRISEWHSKHFRGFGLTFAPQQLC